MKLCELRTDAEGYLVNPAGERVVFYECDPAKNFLCPKTMCRGCVGVDEAKIGFCSSTLERAFSKDGSKPFYKRLNADGYYGREYIHEDGDTK